MEDITDITKLVKVLGYTTSPNDNEALNACRMANSILVSHNLTWEQIMSQKTIVIQEIVQGGAAAQKPKDESIEKMLKACLQGVTSHSGRNFIQSLADFYQRKGFLTEKQKEALGKWYANV